MPESVVGALFDRLLDDAALFPPAQMSAHEAVPSHLRHKATWYRSLVGPFVCPDTRASEVVEAAKGEGLGEERKSLELSIIVTSGPAGLGALGGWSPAAALAALEVPLGPPAMAVEAVGQLAGAVGELPEELAGVPVFAEVPWQEPAVVGQVLDVLARCGARAKLRTGGMNDAAFPRETDVASFIREVVRRGLVFKCTAGLHEAVRVKGRTGYEQMGFANILVATAAALDGASEGDLAAILAERDEACVAKEVSHLRPGVRDTFASIGTCSVSEPVAELVRLGLLESPE